MRVLQGFRAWGFRFGGLELQCPDPGFIEGVASVSVGGLYGFYGLRL